MTPNKVIIDLDAIRHNFLEIKRLVQPKAGIIAVVKSDAYGHGMIPVAKALEPLGPDYFGVFELQEALDLRKSGCKKPILVMMGVAMDEISKAIENSLTISLFQQDIAKAISLKALEKSQVVPVHIKVDTGMARLGISWKKVAPFLQNLLPLRGIHLEGIFTHLAVSDELGHHFTEKQLERFSKAVQEAKELGLCTKAVHVSNSGGILTYKGHGVGLVRPGISLYGSPPSEGLAVPVSLKPAMTFKSRIVQVKTVPAGSPVSYGCTYQTNTEAKIATIPVGYDDGFNRLLSNKGEVIIHGKKVPVVGRVCMNLTMVDVSSLEGVSVGDEVVLLGTQGQKCITAEDMAHKIGTISYEVYCTIGKANLRTYLALD